MESALEKTLDVLSGVDNTELQNDANDYFKFERMKQRWKNSQSSMDTLYPFFSGITVSSKGIYDKAKRLFDIAEQEAGQKKIKRTDEYEKYSILVGRMVDLAKVYDYFNSEYSGNESGGEIQQVERIKSLVKQALHDNYSLESTVLGMIDEYCRSNGDNDKKRLLHTLISAIKHIAAITDDYIDKFQKESVSAFYNKYRSTYNKLSKIGTNRLVWLTSKKSQTTDENLNDAFTKLDILTKMTMEMGLTELNRKINSLEACVSKIRNS